MDPLLAGKGVPAAMGGDANKNYKLNGPFGGNCGPAGSALATWIPDFSPEGCQAHDNCYDKCAKSCGGEQCKLACDFGLQRINYPYGKATESFGDSTYYPLEEECGCQ